MTIEGFETVTLSAGSLEAAFAPALGMAGVSLRHRGDELLDRRHLILDERGIPTGTGDRRPAARFALGGRGFDDGYDGLAARSTFCVAGGGRTLAVELEAGYPAAQMFSPAGRGFICLEPMTAPTNALRSGTGLRHVAPGGTFTAAFSIVVGSL